MIPELSMVALAPREAIPYAEEPFVVIVPELVLVMVALEPKEMIPWPARPLVAIHPVLVIVSPIVVDRSVPTH